MNIVFGKVERYIKDRGFGFVSDTFSKKATKEGFFHIKVVQRTHPELVNVLTSSIKEEQIYFWYEYKTSHKGKEVIAILNAKQIHQKKYADQISIFTETIKKRWINVHLSESIRKATLDLIQQDELKKLEEHREKIKVKQSKRNELQKIKKDAELKEIKKQKVAQEKIELKKEADELGVTYAPNIEVETLSKRIKAQKVAQEKIREKEFNQLVKEISVLGFTHSAQVSNYIVKNRLGHKYKHISGILKMENTGNGNIWKFDGGFPSDIYARLCNELKLGNQGSQAVPVSFTPYKNII